MAVAYAGCQYMCSTCTIHVLVYMYAAVLSSVGSMRLLGLATAMSNERVGYIYPDNHYL